MNAPDRRDSSALVPWYLNGTLSEEDRRDVEAWIRISPDADAELALWRAVRQEVRSEPLPEASDELGWRRLRRQLPRSGRRPWWLFAAAASVLVIAGLQTTVLLRSGSDIYQPLSQTAPVSEWRFHVRFEDRATLAELSAMLARLDARIVEGPSALGLYTLALPRPAAKDAATLLDRLRAEPLVIDATVAP